MGNGNNGLRFNEPNALGLDDILNGLHSLTAWLRDAAEPGRFDAVALLEQGVEVADEMAEGIAVAWSVRYKFADELDNVRDQRPDDRREGNARELVDDLAMDLRDVFELAVAKINRAEGKTWIKRDKVREMQRDLLAGKAWEGEDTDVLSYAADGVLSTLDAEFGTFEPETLQDQRDALVAPLDTRVSSVDPDTGEVTTLRKTNWETWVPTNHPGTSVSGDELPYELGLRVDEWPADNVMGLD